MRVNVLGPLVVETGGRSVTVAGAKQQALVALLALDAGRGVTAERLIDDLWGDGGPADVANALHHQVSRLRRTLGPARILHRGPAYELVVVPDDVDALRFERLLGEGRAHLRAGNAAEAAAVLRAAEALWRGAPLAGIDADRARAEAARFDRLHVGLLEDRLAADLRLGRYDEVAVEAASLAAAHPERERLWTHLIEADYRAGRQAAALAAARRARAALAEGHGLDPGPELRELEAAILRQDPALEPPGPAGPIATRPATAGPPAGNVPVPLTSYVGRDGQPEAVRTQLGGCRLLTLTGPGGCGKTRLALEAARTASTDFPDGTWVVELASVADPAAVADAVSAVLSAGRAGRVSAAADVGPATAGAGLVEYLRDRRALLLLDNCEHLLPGLAAWVDVLLAAAAGVHVLATSREPLGIPGEAQWPVPPLGLPPAGTDDPLVLAGADAVALFTDRAHRAGGLEAIEDALPVVAEICRRLDGLPLAIELAAARTKALPVGYIAGELGDRFGLLISTSRTVPERQRTLRAAVDWSYALLGTDERALFEAMSVFEGGASLEAVLAVADHLAPPHRVRDLVAGLVDKSLVIARADDGAGPRYELLETLRDYGRERLAESGGLEAARAAHRCWVRAFVDEAEAGLLSRDHRIWHRRLEREYGNVRAAVTTAIAAGAWADALGVAGALWWFWASTDRHAEARAWLGTALAGPGAVEPAIRFRALTTFCYLAGQLHDVDVAIAAGEEALAGALAAGDGKDFATAWARQSLGLTLEVAGRHEEAAAMLGEARILLAADGQDWRVAGNELVTAVRGLAVGDLDLVDASSRAALARAEAIGYDPFVSWAQLMRATVAECRGDVPAARTSAAAAVAAAHDVDTPHHLSLARAQASRIALLDGDLRAAVADARGAVEAAEVGGSSWLAALGRARLAAALRASGDGPGAEEQRRRVRSWAADPARGHAPHLFVVLGGDPATQI
ncbi:hypothetical protein GCM10009836_60880 [Pseudonocardia ailaonensis]|uniref:OmpR/PhoB-type domain-containing protein n=1 Tax=Pseudonocardia ailaonensis TaxID=367279 RepID=A0ABN2NJB7_9PSEU